MGTHCERRGAGEPNLTAIQARGTGGRPGRAFKTRRVVFLWSASRKSRSPAAHPWSVASVNTA